MKGRTTGAPLVAALVAAGTYLMCLLARTGSSGDAFMAFLVFSIVAAPAFIAALLIGAALRKHLGYVGGIVLGVLTGAATFVGLFAYMAGGDAISSARHKAERKARSSKVLDLALATGFPNLPNAELMDNYQLDFGPSAVLRADESAMDRCADLKKRRGIDWAVSDFGDGCWAARRDASGRNDFIKVSPAETGSNTTYIVGAAQSKVEYYLCVRFLELAASKNFKGASTLVSPDYLEQLSGIGGVEGFFKKYSLEYPRPNLYEGPSGEYSQELRDGKFVILWLADGAMPRIRRIAVSDKRY